MWVGTVLVALLLATSSCVIIDLVGIPQLQAYCTSKYRLICLLMVHAVLIIYTFLNQKLNTLQQRTLLTFTICFIVLIAMTGCQILVKGIESEVPSHIIHTDNGGFQKIEIIYLYFYFAAYACATFGFFSLAIYLAVTHLSVRNQEERLNEDMERCLEKRVFRRQFGEVVCAICLDEMNDSDEKYIQIKICRHLFHQECLLDWLHSNNTCPLCRQDILQWLGHQLIEE